MAWVGQCRVAFKANADAILWRQSGKKKITQVLRQLSEESGIPYKTLWRWWDDQEKEKNLKTETIPDSLENSGSSPEKLIKSDHPMCIICGERKVQRKRKAGGGWHYYDKCWKCRTIGTPAYEEKADISILCPLCGGRFKLKKGDLHHE